jgi:hypothetical protein
MGSVLHLLRQSYTAIERGPELILFQALVRSTQSGDVG